MTIIHFPGAHRPPACTPDPSLRLAIGTVTFTCTACGRTTKADFHNMVFRSLEFYCLSCGSSYRMANPAFEAGSKK